MMREAIQLDDLPPMKDPLLIAGFEGWGNALDVSRGMADYMIEKLKARASAPSPRIFSIALTSIGL
jgi:proteasome assembly chaperone (PAC2) family protein